MGYRRRSHALRKRYGRAWQGDSAITVPRADGKVDVILVDAKGTHRKTLARGVPYKEAVRIIRKH